jgi:hypothetical protein
MRHSLLKSLVLSMLLAPAGCYIDATAPEYAEDDNGTGDLVEVSPGVEVVADYDEPIFFANDYYWVNRGGYWYSSTWYGGGWIRATSVPHGVMVIQRPRDYIHYRPQGYVRHEAVQGGYVRHEDYHAQHVTGGGVRVRAAVHGGRRH